MEQYAHIKFKERFNQIIKTCGKTQVEIARAINVSKQCVNDYKAGKSMPSVETLILMCEFLNVSADYLLGLSDKE